MTRLPHVWPHDGGPTRDNPGRVGVGVGLVAARDATKDGLARRELLRVLGIVGTEA